MDQEDYLSKLNDLEPQISSARSCCYLGKAKRLCTCEYAIYKIRPYAFDILRAIQPFFELVGISNIPHYELEQIVDHIESVLNKPIADMMIEQQK